jgi:ATP-binding cassette subfamily C protein
MYQVAGAFLLTVFVYAGLSWLHMPLATLLTLVFIFSRLLPIFASGQQQYHYWLHALPSVEHTYALIEQAESLAEPYQAESFTRQKITQAITLDQVCVQYQGREQKALDKLTLRLAKHTTTAIMGESGAGKSTLADVLMGLLTIDAGQFQVDGREITGIERMRWRNMVAYVPQDIFLFNDSIRHNLLWGNAEASEAELIQSLERAAAEFVFALPEGLDTRVGDGGILLSGGERQRIALARALLKKPALLILDEATSALDTHNEARIRQAIENLHGDLTVLIIGHRIATLEYADQIIVMDKGRIKTQSP